MSSTGEAALAISPPAIIFICIAGGAILIVIFAATDKLCRRGETQERDPFKRSAEQDEYMKTVRWRTKMLAWDDAQLLKLTDGTFPHEEYRLAVLRRRYEAQRARERDDFYGNINLRVRSAQPIRDLTPEEFLLTGNPYRELLRASAPVPSDRNSEEQQSRIDLSQHDNLARNIINNNDFEEVAFKMPPTIPQHNATGVQIMVNDESEDIVDDAMVGSSRWPPRQSRMFRSSSIYSGDDLLPSTHLHLVQSSSSYALGSRQPVTGTQQNVGEQEQSNRG